MLIEKLRKMYCIKYDIPYNEITEKTEDFRAKRITSYLNLINSLAEKKFEEFKNATIEKGNMIKEYFNKLPDYSTIKQEFNSLTKKYLNLTDIQNWIKENISMGSVDVNIMTKVDKENSSIRGSAAVAPAGSDTAPASSTATLYLTILPSIFMRAI